MVTIDQYFNKIPPPILSHFTDVHGLVGILAGKALWATHIRFLNDSREFVHAVSLAEQRVKELLAASPSITDRLVLEGIGSTLQSTSGNTTIISLSEEADLLSQWRGYCPDGGYSLQFNTEVLFRRASQQNFAFVQCCYELDEQVNLINEMISSALAAFPDFVSPHGAYDDSMRCNHFVSLWLYPKILRLFSAMKDVAFSEEREWRIIGGLKKGMRGSLRPRNGMLTPYQTLTLGDGAQIETGIMNSITVGPCRFPELAEFGLASLVGHGFVENSPLSPHAKRSSIPYRAA